MINIDLDNIYSYLSGISSLSKTLNIAPIKQDDFLGILFACEAKVMILLKLYKDGRLETPYGVIEENFEEFVTEVAKMERGIEGVEINDIPTDIMAKVLLYLSLIGVQDEAEKIRVVLTVVTEEKINALFSNEKEEPNGEEEAQGQLGEESATV